jgi:predicted Zn-dependent peptidase
VSDPQDPTTSRFGALSALTLVVAGAALAVPGGAQQLPRHPRELKYPPLAFEVPRAEEHRHVLSSGVVVYVFEDHALPLVDITLHSRIGYFLDPTDGFGVANLTGAMLREGGAGDWTAEQLDERADFLAANLGSGTGETGSSASVDCLATALSDCLDLLFTMVQRPRFQQDRLDIEKGNLREQMKQRNDDPGSILDREWEWLLYGADHFGSRRHTEATVAAIDRDDLAAFHRRWWGPEGLVVAVSGDVDVEAIVGDLERRFAAWPEAAGGAPPWPPPAPGYQPKPGLYHVEKDIPQGRTRIGHLTRQWDPQWSDPQAYAALVMNDILGGGGFTSRITQRIRSDEGLAYSAGSSLGIGTFWPGSFQVFFQSKNETVAYATKIALDEVRRMQEQPPSEEELRVSKGSFVESFPRGFESATAVANRFAGDEIVGRPHEYWYRYRERIAAVTAEQVQAAARAELHPDRLVVLTVGPWAQIAAGDPQGRAKVEALGLGPVTQLPLRDPLTLEPKP